MTPPKLLPPHYFALSVLGMIGMRLALDAPLLPTPWTFSGLVPIVLGGWLALKGSRLFAQAGTNIIPFTESSALVTEGVFARSRNPMYLGMILTLAGVALLLNTALPWLVVVGFALLLRFGFVRVEERLMEATFGAAYLDYRTRVRRWC